MGEHVVFLDRAVVPGELVRPEFQHVWDEYPDTPESLIVERLQMATIAITNHVPLKAEHLSVLPNLRLICVAGTGYDIVDIGACDRLGIPVSNVRDWCTTAVAEHVFALIFTLSRRLLQARDHVLAAAAHWSPAEFLFVGALPSQLEGSTIGLIGHGILGSRVAKIADVLGMKVLIAEHKRASHLRSGRTPFEDVLRRSDIVSIHCPLSEDTRDLIGNHELALMRPDAILINCARGPIVNCSALTNALIAGALGGAGLDTTNEETSSLVTQLRQLRLLNLILTPHIAWASKSSVAELADQLKTNMESFARGEPVRVVNSIGFRQPPGRDELDL